MGFSNTKSSGAIADQGMTPQQQAARAKKQRTLDALEEARKQILSGSPSGCMDALFNATNIVANDYDIDPWYR